jgi:aspartyl-tRNA(Asn)/glutamyl-tRNA(Gln) amidotransferase subunit A
MTRQIAHHSDFSSLTALQLIAGYRDRLFSPVEVVSDLLAGVEALNAQLNAFYFIDPDGALKAARESEARWLNGRPVGLLDGVPSSVKDALEAAGWPAYRGSAAYHPDRVTGQTDTPSIARMREHGTILVGKTTMPDFGILASGKSSKHGVTRNPFDLAATPGGSSAGTAASIAANLTPLAVGTDIVGSIRLPASFCGLFGLKPSQGRVPYYFPNSPALVAGPMSRTVQDAALLMNVITQPDARDFTSLAYDHGDYLLDLEGNLRKGRIGFLPSLGFGVAADEEVVELVSAACGQLAGEGFEVVPVQARFDEGDLRVAESFYKVRALTELNTMPLEMRTEAKFIHEWTQDVSEMTATDMYNLFNRMNGLRERAARLIDGFDFLVLPSVHTPAFAADTEGPSPGTAFMPWINCFLFNLTCQPASSVPCGVNKAGLPVGMQIVGRRFDDRGVLKLSRLYERMFPERFLGAPLSPE